MSIVHGSLRVLSLSLKLVMTIVEGEGLRKATLKVREARVEGSREALSYTEPEKIFYYKGRVEKVHAKLPHATYGCYATVLCSLPADHTN